LHVTDKQIVESVGLRLIFAFCVPLSALPFISCSRKIGDAKLSPSEANVYFQDLNASRLQKDAYFKTAPSSPLTPEQRTTFQHLNYFPPNLNLVFQLKLVKITFHDSVGIAASGGEMRPAVNFGEFNFEVGGKELHLHVYKMIGEDSTDLFLPFTDETSGTTTYAGGRYIDLKEDSSEIYNLDFNYAYNPYCAYNHNYSCPIVPKENYLDVPIMAGEKNYSK